MGRKPIVKDKNKFVKMWNDNISEKNMAKKFGITRGTVSLTAKKFGLKRRSSGGIKVRTPEQIDKFTRMWKEGLLTKQIAKEFNIAIPTVHNAAKRFGLEKRYSGPVSYHATDEEIIGLIKNKGVISIRELSQYLKLRKLQSFRLRKLVCEERISTFRLIIGRGRSRKRGAMDLFDGIGQRKYYYVDTKIAAKFIIGKLKLNSSVDLIKRQRLTRYLKNTLKPDLFAIIYQMYS